MSKVFVTQSTRHPIAKAEAYGEIVVLHFGDIADGHDEEVTLEMFERSAGIMQDFDPATDHLLLTGNPMLIGWAVHLACEIAETQLAKSISWLYWDRKLERYLPCNIPIPTLVSGR